MLAVIGKRSSSWSKSPQMTWAGVGEAFGVGVLLAVVEDGDVHAQERADLPDGESDVTAADDEQGGGGFDDFDQDFDNGFGGLDGAPAFDRFALGGEGDGADEVLGDGGDGAFADGVLERSAADGAQSSGVGVDEHFLAGGRGRQLGRRRVRRRP